MGKSHISSEFDQDLTSLKNRILLMGGLVEQQVTDAVIALGAGNSELAEQVRSKDKEVDALEKSIDEDCVRIIALRQPAAVDLRLVMSVTKIVMDLERIGDEAKKIAKLSLLMSEEGGAPRGSVEVRHIGQHVGRMVHDTLDSFTRLDCSQALDIMKEDKIVDAEYKSAMRSLVTFMMEDPRSISLILNVMWALRALERIGDHARNVAEQVIYMVEGRDVRHTPLAEVQSLVQKDG